MTVWFLPEYHPHIADYDKSPQKFIDLPELPCPIFPNSC